MSEPIPIGNKDHRAWIQKILEREKRGDPTLSPIALQKAREALNGDFRKLGGKS